MRVNGIITRSNLPKSNFHRIQNKRPTFITFFFFCFLCPLSLFLPPSVSIRRFCHSFYFASFIFSCRLPLFILAFVFHCYVSFFLLIFYFYVFCFFGTHFLLSSFLSCHHSNRISIHYAIPFELTKETKVLRKRNE